MASSTKISLIFCILIIVGCATCSSSRESYNFEEQSSGSKESYNFEGQSSGSKDVEINTIEDNENAYDVHLCEIELFTAFKNDDPLDNFLYAFLHINEDNFDGWEAYGEMTKAYYYDLLHTVSQLIVNCLDAIRIAGCENYIDGNICINHLYLNWKLRTENPSTPISGTENLSNEMLLLALYKGFQNPQYLDNENLLLLAYRDSNGFSQQLLEDHISNVYEDYLRRYGAERRNPNVLDFQSFRRNLQELIHQNDLSEARYERYGVRSASYKDLGREFIRRSNIPKFYDNYYAVYLFKEIKNQTHECSLFKNRNQFCKNHLKEMKNAQSGSQKNVLY